MNSARMRAIKLLKMKSGEERLSKHLIPILAEYQENLGEGADTVRYIKMSNKYNYILGERSSGYSHF